MDLVRAEQALGRHAHLFGHPPAIFRDTGGIIVGAQPAIEGFVDSTGHPALAGEERVAQPRNGCEQRRSERHAVSSPGAGGSSLRPATAVRLGSVIASTLNIDPMPPRPLSVRRFSAAEIAADTSGGVLPISVRAGVAMPSRFTKSPSVTAPCTRAPPPSPARARA